VTGPFALAADLLAPEPGRPLVGAVTLVGFPSPVLAAEQGQQPAGDRPAGLGADSAELADVTGPLVGPGGAGREVAFLLRGRRQTRPGTVGRSYAGLACVAVHMAEARALASESDLEGGQPPVLLGHSGV
jgi:hypothetical protein